MERRLAKIIIGLFCVFWGGITIISLLLPDKEFSEMENRNLQLLPKLIESKWKSGAYMEEMESYVADQIVFRDQWVGVKASVEVLSGKKENNGVYFGEKETLINRVVVEDEALVRKNVEYMNQLSQNISVPIYFGLIPTAAEVWDERLPKGADTLDEMLWIEKIYQSINVETVDLEAALEQHDDEPIFYKTDHHWTSLGAYYGANAIFEKMEQKCLDLRDYDKEIVSNQFYGTTYSSAGAWWVEPDQVECYVSEEGKSVISNFTGKEEIGKLYNYEKLDGKNKYAFFMGGNQPYCVIKSNMSGEKLLVIRDSYSDCLAPFLSERFEEIHMFDLRYNRMSIKEYVEEHKMDKVLILYSFSNYIKDENQFLLIR